MHEVRCLQRGNALEVRHPVTVCVMLYGLTIEYNMGSMGIMKTTLDIQDELLARAKRYAHRTGRPLRAVVEEGLRRALEAEGPVRPYVLPDYSVGEAGARDPLEAYSWQDLRGVIYGESEAR